MKGADCGPSGLQDLKSKESNECFFPVAQLMQGKHGPHHKNTLLAAAGYDLRGCLRACGWSVPGFTALTRVSLLCPILAAGGYAIKEQSLWSSVESYSLGVAAPESGSTDTGSSFFLPVWQSTEAGW